MDVIAPKSQELSFENVWLLFQETDRKWQETDKRWQESEKLLTEKFQELARQQARNDELFKSIHEELGGIGKSNGEIAEDFFYSALSKSLQIGKLKFDYIDRNLRRKRNNTEAEFDIILYNNYKVVVVEIKHNFKAVYLRDFYKEKLKRFRTLFPEYKEFKLYGTIAALTFEKGVIADAKNYGFYVLTQDNDNVKLLNSVDFEPNDIK